MALSVIGAGLGRTGTLSLKFALEQLGLGPCYHMMEVFRLPQASRQWSDAADGKPVNWDEVFEGFGSAVDWPSAEFYKPLADYYPQAKVILTVRDPQSWYESTQATIFNFDNHSGANPEWLEMIGKVIGAKFNGDLHTRDHVIDVYNRHNDEVRRTIPAERLLEYTPGQGWGPLCEFLGLPVPEQPYPKVNTTEDFVGRIKTAREAAPPA
jgi:hypothetical protein